MSNCNGNSDSNTDVDSGSNSNSNKAEGESLILTDFMFVIFPGTNYIWKNAPPHVRGPWGPRPRGRGGGLAGAPHRGPSKWSGIQE